MENIINMSTEGFTDVTEPGAINFKTLFDVIVKHRKSGEVKCTFTSHILQIRYKREHKISELVFGANEKNPIPYTAGITYGLNIKTDFYDMYIREHKDDVPFEASITF